MTAASVPQPTAVRIPLSYVVALVPVGAALNVVGGTINTALQLPTFLDMIGTAVVAILLGPWWGALVGVMGNVGGAFFTGPVGIPFALVNVAGALVWGYGVRSFGMGATATRFFILNVIVAFVTSAIAAPIVVFVFGGATGHSSDALTAAFAQAGQGPAGRDLCLERDRFPRRQDHQRLPGAGDHRCSSGGDESGPPPARPDRDRPPRHRDRRGRDRGGARRLLPFHHAAGRARVMDRTVGPREGLGAGIIAIGVLAIAMPFAVDALVDTPDQAAAILAGMSILLGVFVVIAGLASFRIRD